MTNASLWILSFLPCLYQYAGFLPFTLEMNEEDVSLATEAHLLSSQLAEMQNKKRNINEKKASMVYEEGQLANMMDFIRSHEINGCFVPETDFHEEEIMLLLEQVRVLEHGYIISFKVEKTVEVHLDA